MTLPWFLPIRVLTLILVICVIAVTVSAMTQSPAIDVLSLDARDNTWTTATFSYRQAPLNGLTQQNIDALWGRNKTEETTTNISTPWTLKGIIKESGYKVALIEVDIHAKSLNQDRFKRFKEGDKLPDGSILKRIHKNYIEYEKGETAGVKRFFESQ